MISNKFFKALLLMCIPLISASLAWPVQAADIKPRREIEDKHFELVHIPLSPWPRTERLNNYKPNFYGFWLDNTQLVMSVLQDVPDAYAKKLERIMLIDTSTGASRVLVEQGSLKCRSRKFQMMVYLPYHYQYGYYGDNPAQFRSDHRYVRVGSDGQLRDLDGPSPIDQNCDPVGLNRDWGQSHPLLEGDGYIDTSARDDYENKILGTAKLVRPGKQPLELGIPNASVAWPIYLPHYDKYLMSAWDYGTGGKTAGQPFWKFNEFSPYWLVNRDGKVDSVPYPKIIAEYGMVGFQYLWPTPHGLLIDHLGGRLAGNGLLLLQGERLLRIWGGPLSLNFFKTNYGRGESSYVLNISPDGCRVVFTHARNYPRLPDKNPDPVPLSVLNLCKEL